MLLPAPSMVSTSSFSSIQSTHLQQSSSMYNKQISFVYPSSTKLNDYFNTPKTHIINPIDIDMTPSWLTPTALIEWLLIQNDTQEQSRYVQFITQVSTSPAHILSHKMILSTLRSHPLHKIRTIPKLTPLSISSLESL